MVALPCGSRSTISTRCPTLPRPAARFTVVVVLPTPPFWLATQKIFAIRLMPSRSSLGDRELDAEPQQEDARHLFEHSSDQGVGAHPLGQVMREEHHRE